MSFIPRIAAGVGGSLAARAAYRILTSDKFVLNKSWSGFKAKDSIVGGIRTGLLGGSLAGSLINDGSNPFNDAEVPQGNVSTPYQQYKKHSRFNSSGRYGRKRKQCYCGTRRKRLHRRSY